MGKDGNRVFSARRGNWEKLKEADRLLFYLMLALAALMAVFAVALQPDLSIFSGFWKIQTSPAGLITDPICIGGPGGALLNAALILLCSTMLVRLQRIPFTGLAVACLSLMAGFALLGKNVVNSFPIVLGGFLYARFKDEPFSRYTFMTLFATCLSPMVSHFLVYSDPRTHYVAMMLCGTAIGFITPAVSAYTVRVHQGYNLYNVGFAAGFVGLAMVSVLRAFGMQFETKSSWSTEYDAALTILVALVLLALFVLGLLFGCRSWAKYRHILSHSGRAVADFFALEGLAPTFINMALVGGIGLAYLKLVQVPLNGPLVCCLFTMTGFGCFGKHPRNVIPVMVGAVIAGSFMTTSTLTSPGVLLATLLCTGIAPIAGKFGAFWGIAAGFLHMTIVQNTAYLFGGLNLYNNGFAAGLTCVVMIPLIEALKTVPED